MSGAAPLWIEPALAAIAIGLAVTGMSAALALRNAMKRLAGLLIAGLGAIAVLAALGAPDGALVVGVAVLFAQAVIGAAIVVRLQEAYGSIETSEVDAADAAADIERDRVS